jgi:uncharacterized membrane protein
MEMLNKEKFLQELAGALTRLPVDERDDIVRDYEEYFAAGQANGKTEAEIAKALGSPKKIARELLADYHVDAAVREWSFANIWKAVRSVSMVAFVNSVLILGAYCAGLVLLLGGWLTGMALTFFPLTVLIIHGIQPLWPFSYIMFVAVAVSGVGLLINVLMWAVSRWFKQGFLHYLKFTLALWKGGEQHGQKE